MTRDVTTILSGLDIPEPTAIDEGSLAAGLGLGEMALVAEVVGLESLDEITNPGRLPRGAAVPAPPGDDVGAGAAAARERRSRAARPGGDTVHRHGFLAARARHPPLGERARAAQPFDPRGTPAARAIAGEIVTIAVALGITPAQVRELTWDELEAWIAVLRKRERRAAARRRRA